MAGGRGGVAPGIGIVRDRAWLFIPFAVLGVLTAFLLDQFLGTSTATATMRLDVLVQDVGGAGDRGMRIFEAQAMTGDDNFRAQVLEAIGDPDFDYARFDISLKTVTVAEGVTRGDLKVSIEDDSKGDAERFRQAFVDVFTRNYAAQDGLFRTRLIDRQRQAVARFENEYKALYEKLRPEAEGRGIPLDELVRSRPGSGSSLIDELNQQETALRTELAQLQTILATPAAVTGVQASAILRVPVTDGEAFVALATRQQVVIGALNALQGRRGSLSDGNFPEDLQTSIDQLRALADAKDAASADLARIQVVATNAQSSISTLYSVTGSPLRTWPVWLGITLGVMVVGGIVAIFAVGWLKRGRVAELEPVAPEATGAGS